MIKQGILRSIKSDTELLISVIGEEKEVIVTGSHAEIEFAKELIEDNEEVITFFDNTTNCLTGSN